MYKLIALSLLCMMTLHAENPFYGEDGQDRYAYEHFFQDKANGIFIDIGAHEGVLYSNTFFFEQLGWKGICFEPNPATYAKLIKNRQSTCLQACISNTNEKKLFVAHPCTWVSGLLDKYNPKHANTWNVQHLLDNKSADLIVVDCYLLNDILEKYEMDHVDFLSIDTEGGELDILKSIDFQKYDIKVIVVENIYEDPGYKSFLESKGYTYATRLHRDEIYYKPLSE